MKIKTIIIKHPKILALAKVLSEGRALDIGIAKAAAFTFYIQAAEVFQECGSGIDDGYLMQGTCVSEVDMGKELELAGLLEVRDGSVFLYDLFRSRSTSSSAMRQKAYRDRKKQSQVEPIAEENSDKRITTNELQLEQEQESRAATPRKKEDSAEFISLKNRLYRYFNRREDTKLSEKERKGINDVLKLNLSEEDLAMLDWWFLDSGTLYKRKDLQTLLNNFQAEIDRAKNEKDRSEARGCDNGEDIWNIRKD